MAGGLLTTMAFQTIVSAAIFETATRSVMKKNGQPPATAVDLTPAMFQVLLALGDGEKHGYAILKEVEQQTNGHVRLSTGTLYAMIKRLVSDGIIAECRNRPPAEEDDQRRRYY